MNPILLSLVSNVRGCKSANAGEPAKGGRTDISFKGAMAMLLNNTSPNEVEPVKGFLAQNDPNSGEDLLFTEQLSQGNTTIADEISVLRARLEQECTLPDKADPAQLLKGLKKRDQSMEISDPQKTVASEETGAIVCTNFIPAAQQAATVAPVDGNTPVQEKTADLSMTAKGGGEDSQRGAAVTRFFSDDAAPGEMGLKTYPRSPRRSSEIPFASRQNGPSETAVFKGTSLPNSGDARQVDIRPTDARATEGEISGAVETVSGEGLQKGLSGASLKGGVQGVEKGGVPSHPFFANRSANTVTEQPSIKGQADVHATEGEISGAIETVSGEGLQKGLSGDSLKEGVQGVEKGGVPSHPFFANRSANTVTEQPSTRGQADVHATEGEISGAVETVSGKGHQNGLSGDSLKEGVQGVEKGGVPSHPFFTNRLANTVTEQPSIKGQADVHATEGEINKVIETVSSGGLEKDLSGVSLKSPGQGEVKATALNGSFSDSGFYKIVDTPRVDLRPEDVHAEETAISEAIENGSDGQLAGILLKSKAEVSAAGEKRVLKNRPPAPLNAAVSVSEAEKDPLSTPQSRQSSPLQINSLQAERFSHFASGLEKVSQNTGEPDSGNAAKGWAHVAQQVDPVVVGSDQPVLSAERPAVNSVPAYLVDQVGRQIARYLQRGERVLTLQLKPPEMGTLKVGMDMHKDVLKLEMIAETSSAKDALLAHMQELKSALGEQGIKLANVAVEVGTAFSQSMADTGQGSGQGADEGTRGPALGRGTETVSDEADRSARPAAIETDYLINLVA